MFLEGDLAKVFLDAVREHLGHKLTVVEYGETIERPVNVAVECEDCQQVLVDANVPAEPMLTFDALEVVREVVKTDTGDILGHQFRALQLGVGGESTDFGSADAVMLNGRWFLPASTSDAIAAGEQFRKAGGGRG